MSAEAQRGDRGRGVALANVDDSEYCSFYVACSKTRPLPQPRTNDSNELVTASSSEKYI